MKKWTKSIRIAGLAVGLVFLGLPGPSTTKAESDEDFLHFGLIEYEVSCLPCHGIDGRGAEFDAEQLAVQPTDLTAIAKSNGGTFPAEKVAVVIDGRAIVAAHGPREMPVWGDRYRMPASDEEESSDIELVARSRIDALVRYIETLQCP